MNKEFFEALEELSIEKGINKDYLLDAIETALLTAYKKNFNAEENVKIIIDEEKAVIQVFSLREVVEEVFDPAIEISLDEARKINKRAQIGDIVEVEITPKDFGRIAAQTAKQVIVQKIREAEREIVFTEYSDRQGEIVSGLIQKVDKNEKQMLIREILTPFVGELIVTPKDIDTIIESLAKIIADGINIAVQPEMEMEEINKFLN